MALKGTVQSKRSAPGSNTGEFEPERVKLIASAGLFGWSCSHVLGGFFKDSNLDNYLRQKCGNPSKINTRFRCVPGVQLLHYAKPRQNGWGVKIISDFDLVALFSLTLLSID